ncbi:unnamed protein product [Arctogadus glacialis]
MNVSTPPRLFPPILCESLSLFLSFPANSTPLRYGSAAGQATDLAMNSAINVGVTAFNIDNLGIKAVVKRTGKQTAAALLEDYKLQDAPGQEKQMEKFKK